MKEIKVYQFNELSKDAQLRAIAEHRAEINETALTYLKEIYTDHVDELNDTGIFKSKVFSMSMTEPYLISFDTECYDSTDYTISGSAVRETLKYAIECDTWFTEEIESTLADYNDEDALPLVALTLVNKLNEKAFKWYMRFTTDDEYTRKYILGEVSAQFCSEDIFSDTEFLEDGSVVKY